MGTDFNRDHIISRRCKLPLKSNCLKVENMNNFKTVNYEKEQVQT